MRDAVGIPWPAEEIGREVERRLIARYRADLPLIPGRVRGRARPGRALPARGGQLLHAPA